MFVLVVPPVQANESALLPELFVPLNIIVASVPLPVIEELPAVVYPCNSTLPLVSTEELKFGKKLPPVTDWTVRSAPAKLMIASLDRTLVESTFTLTVT